MKIGIIGRNQSILSVALTTAQECGHHALGTTSDKEALLWLAERRIAALVIGGGVETASRLTLINACRSFDIQPVEIVGPEHLRSALAELT
jgi:hypothetical protein